MPRWSRRSRHDAPTAREHAEVTDFLAPASHPCQTLRPLDGKPVSRTTRLSQATAKKPYLLQTAGTNRALVMRTLVGSGIPQGWAERTHAKFLGRSAWAGALLQWWHAHIQSRIAFSRAAEIFHAPEHRILLRRLGLCPTSVRCCLRITSRRARYKAGGPVVACSRSAQCSVLVPGFRLRGAFPRACIL